MAVYAQEPNIESTTIADAAGVNIATVSAAGALKIDGSAVNQPVVGTKTNNNVAPGATNAGVLPAIANAVAPAWTEGNQVLASVDLSGNLRVIQGIKSTYSSGSLAMALATSATDIWTIAGSATKTIRVLSITLLGIKTTAGQELIVLVKRSTANTGGTSTSNNGTPHDSTNATGTATVSFYTANPTALGTAVGFVRSARVFWPALASVTAPSILQWDFTSPTEQGIVLRGTTQLLAINMQSGSVAGDTAFVSVTWTEE